MSIKSKGAIEPKTPPIPALGGQVPVVIGAIAVDVPVVVGLAILFSPINHSDNKTKIPIFSNILKDLPAFYLS